MFFLCKNQLIRILEDSKNGIITLVWTDGGLLGAQK
jgi:hypothetical protein